MKTSLTVLLLGCISAFSFTGCQKSTDANGSTSSANLVFKFKFDSTQTRLNNVGQPSPIAAGNAGQSPVFNKMSAHYIEMTLSAMTPLGGGTVLYRAEETTIGGSNAINFEKASLAGNGEVFFTIPIKDIKKGDYEWLRVSLAYQNFDVKYLVDTTISGITVKQQFPGTLAGFIGFNTYIKTLKIKNQNIAVNANKKQGFWGFETTVNLAGATYPYATSGQAPEGAITVVNPIFATSPIPQGSCVVTAAFAPGKLSIRGNETKDILVEVSLSTNKSFEWKEVINDDMWEPSKGENVVDMGIRGMLAKIQ